MTVIKTNETHNYYEETSNNPAYTYRTVVKTKLISYRPLTAMKTQLIITQTHEGLEDNAHYAEMIAMKTKLIIMQNYDSYEDKK
jgi:hypothetical protein